MNRGFATLLLALLLIGCLPQNLPPVTVPWVYTDLRFLDEAGPAKGTLLPGQDLIAVYTRVIDQELQIRLDLLDLNPRPEVDLYLALDISPGGNDRIFANYPTELGWDTLVAIPAAAPIQIENAEGSTPSGLSVRVERDPQVDTITINLDRDTLPITSLDQRFQIFLTRPGDSSPVDWSPIVESGMPSPPRVPALLTFWNTLAAYTPSQAMRRWDGAHTGPLGGRHGLRNLLRVARSHQVPLALLDTKLPTTLSALDYVEGMQMVRAMAEEGLLILPDAVSINLPGLSPELIEQALSVSRATATSANLPSSAFAYVPSSFTPGSIPSNYDLIFTGASNTFMTEGTGSTLVLRSRTERVVPLPALTATSSDLKQSNDGPPLDLRRAFLNFSFHGAENPGSGMLLVGGDFQQSPWGDPQFARQVFDWVKAHPWIKLLGPQDLLALRTNGEYSPFGNENQIIAQNSNTLQMKERINSLGEQISLAPPGPLAEAARLYLFSLFSQTSYATEELEQLRLHYSRGAGPFLAAAGWFENPMQLRDCSLDLDQDGRAECILASEEIYAVINTQAGSLTNLFARSTARDEQGQQGRTSSRYLVHEIVAPSSQFIFGQGDPGQWDLSAGLAADPDVLPGAFYNRGISFSLLQTGETLTFTAPDIDYTKTYTLLPNGIRADFYSPSPLSVQVPLALDPWLRFEPDWGQRYAGQFSPNQWTWGLAGGPSIMVSSNGEISVKSFNDTRTVMGSVEDPNTDFPPGHFLPFPISLVDVQGQGSFFVEIRFQDP